MELNRPEVGFYWIRRVRKGVKVPVEIGRYSDKFSAMICLVGGEPADIQATWEWCAGNPISRADYNHMMATKEWAEEYAPEQPEANPFRPIDISKLPPAF